MDFLNLLAVLKFYNQLSVWSSLIMHFFFCFFGFIFQLIREAGTSILEILKVHAIFSAYIPVQVSHGQLGH